MLTLALSRLLAATMLVAAVGTAAAAGDTGPSQPDDPLNGARAHITAQRWAAAIEELKRVDARGNADWHNLMGYSYRKARQPDLAAAEHHYDEALRLNPKHRGALEYSGELFLMKGDLPRAEQRLATLDKVCTFSCSEYRELKQAVADYRAGGKR
jgi:tetratricopeptide (TPR) repeat protein